MNRETPRISWFDRLMTAVTFAEAGEAGTALDVRGMDVKRKNPRISRFDRLMAAVTFAEAGEGKAALEITGLRQRKATQKRSRRSSRSTVDHRPRLHA